MSSDAFDRLACRGAESRCTSEALITGTVHAGAGTKCGPAENINVAVPLIETPEHIKASELATRELNAPYLTVIPPGL
jgi:hypothetical protein